MSDKPERPLFLVIEGIDGSGSTTQCDRLTTWLREQGYPVFLTREPSDGPAGMMIRLALSRRLRGAGSENHVADNKNTQVSQDLDPYTLALLYAADRMDHIYTRVKPNLEAGRIVVCDRYFLSSMAYQGVTADEEWVLQINRFAPVPDLCLYLDLPVEAAKERMERTRWTRELFEEESKLRKIRERYLHLVDNPRPEYGPIQTIDGSLSPDSVFEKVREFIEPLLK
jgi:dTMP kinase